MQRDIRLEGARNVRDLGGLVSRSGRTLRAQRFVRADSLENLRALDVINLLEYGVTVDIDLRSLHERQQWGDMLSGVTEVEYVPVALLDGLERHVREMPANLGELYIAALQHCGSGFRSVFRKMIAKPEACMLFHCSAGKDRTGMVAALLLNLAGVPDQQIIDDYAQSAPNLSALLDRLSVHNAPELAHLLGSEPEHMALFLDHLRQKYDSATGYLMAIGLTGAEISTLRTSMFVHH